MLYILFARDDPARAHLRDELLDQHMAYLDHIAPKMVLAGAQMGEDGVTRSGSVMVMNVGSLAEAEAIFHNEPYYKSGLFKTMTITRMRRARWYPEHAPASPDGH